MGHAALGLIGAAFAFAGTLPAQMPAPERIVMVWSYGFSPQPLRLAADKAVTLEFVNRSNSSHDFTARRFFETAAIKTGTVHDGKVELGPRETKSITLVPRAGIYEAHCSHLFHKQMGMSEQIEVY